LGELGDERARARANALENVAVICERVGQLLGERAQVRLQLAHACCGLFVLANGSVEIRV
jgi:hypothetical protein